MSLDINFGNRFSADFDTLAQSFLPKLEPHVEIESEDGELMFTDQVGEMEGEVVTDLRSTTPLQADNPARRACAIDPWVWNRVIYRWEVNRIMKNPQNQYVRSSVFSRNRHINRIIWAGALADAMTGKDGSTMVALPAGQIISAGGTGLTVDKLRETSEKFGEAGVLDEGDPVCFCGTYRQQKDLLESTEVTSSDYNTVRALVNGEINTFLGMTFVWLQSSVAPALVASDRQCVAFSRSGVQLRKPEDMFRRITEREDINYNPQIYLSGDYGVTRLEEVRVVRVDCDES